MTDERRSRDDERKDPSKEGVRIIGAEEAAEALERGDVAQRRGDDEPRYGDRPTSPKTDGPRPVLRFPLGSSSDPRDIERSPVAPAEPISEPVELPHWTEPPTGQVPQLLPDLPTEDGDEDDLDDWTSFATSTPRWRDDDSGPSGDHEGFGDMQSWGEDEEPPLGALDSSERPTHDDYFTFADLDEPGSATSGSHTVFAEEPPEERFGEAWADDGYDEPAPRPARMRREPDDGRPARPTRPTGGDRDLGLAVAVGVALLGLALILFNIGPAAAMILVTVIVGVAAAELFGVLRQVGYEPVTLAGIAGTVGLVVGAYNNGPSAIPTVLFLTTAVCLIWYLVNAGGESPVMNIGVTLFGVLWVGMFGSFAALMLALPAAGGLDDPGTGILLAAILGTVAYDVGGLFVGRNAGSKPLSPASPNKTWEGLIGGCVVAIMVIVLGGIKGFGPIDSVGESVLVGLAVAIAAPLGDLCESLIKRDLGVKDMGTILPGHGGLMDRFDALLFVLPAVYLLATVKDFFI
jgi:phosphatidate cytidylyltransferase